MLGSRRTLGLVGAGALLALAAASTSSAKPTPPRVEAADATGGASPEPPDRAAIVLVVDGARWQDVTLGIDPQLAKGAGLDPRVANAPVMPRLTELVKERGAMLTARATGPNFVSLPGYAEILGGRSPACASNECAPIGYDTVADAVRARATSPRDVAIVASWPDLVRVASHRPEDLVVSAGRTLRHHDEALASDPDLAAALDRGARAPAWPGAGDYRPDRFTAPVALRYLETGRPRFLFVSLGDADEHAHAGDYASYLAALRHADDTVGAIVDALGRMGERGRRTTLFVTADHGRAADFRDHGGRWPESARVWLAVLGPGAAAAHLDPSADRRLADIAPTVRAWLGLPLAESGASADGAGRALLSLGEIATNE